jgi:hypothetical protein
LASRYHPFKETGAKLRNLIWRSESHSSLQADAAAGQITVLRTLS